MSVNIELPSQRSLEQLAPDKSPRSILAPMGQITGQIAQNRTDLVRYRHAPRFAPAGQSTQMIVGATPDTDYQICGSRLAFIRNTGSSASFFPLICLWWKTGPCLH